ncbi:phosphatidic acid phosphatase type 2/haloperoxidase [Haematococcus lacustris]
MSDLTNCRQRSRSKQHLLALWRPDCMDSNLMIPISHRPASPVDLEAKNKHSHGMQLLLKYSSMASDIAVLLALVVLYIGLERAQPRKVFLIRTTLWKHSYPYHENTVPSWTVPVYAIGAPLLAFSLARLVLSPRKVTTDVWYRTLYACLFAIFLTAAITNCLKIAIGRPRPNFVFRCWPDGAPVFAGENLYGGYAVCSTDSATEAEHRKSFPSGHSSWSGAGLGFLTAWLLGQTRAFTGGGRAWPLMLSLVPLLASLVVGVTRITDYWHHVSDVCVGLALGWFIAFVVYLKLYPFFTHPMCDVPLYTLRPARPAKASNIALQRPESTLEGGTLPNLPAAV